MGWVYHSSRYFQIICLSQKRELTLKVHLTDLISCLKKTTYFVPIFTKIGTFSSVCLCSVIVYSSVIQLPCHHVPAGRGSAILFHLSSMENKAMKALYLWNVISCCVACWHLSPWALSHLEASSSRHKHNLPPDITNRVFLLLIIQQCSDGNEGAFRRCLGHLEEMNNSVYRMVLLTGQVGRVRVKQKAYVCWLQEESVQIHPQ